MGFYWFAGDEEVFNAGHSKLVQKGPLEKINFRTVRAFVW